MEFFPSVLWQVKDEPTLSIVAKTWHDGGTSLEYFCLLAYGNVFSLREDHQAAIKSFHRAAEVRPLASLPLLLVAFEFMALEDYQAAGDHFQIALDRDPLCGKAAYSILQIIVSCHTCRLGLGVIFYRQGDFYGAERYLIQATKILSQNYVPFTYLAGLYAKESRTYNDALSAVDEALRLKPKCSKALFIKVSVLAAMGKVIID